MRVLIAGGGTSGHIYPAVSIADQLLRRFPNSEIEFCGTENGLESELVPAAGYKIHAIRASGFPSRLSKKAIDAVLDLYAGKKKCKEIIRDFKPDIVIGTGGYVCGPLIMAAKSAKVPILLHEQNAFPGRANKTMSKWAQVVCTGFPHMENYFKKSKSVEYTGNPIREDFINTTYEEARAALGIGQSFYIFAMGGSLGSAKINEAVVGLSRYEEMKDVRVLLSAGKQQYNAVDVQDIQNNKHNIQIDVREYVSDAHLYMAAADMVICRAGAITCAEIACLGSAAVFIPYPFAAGDHQTFNAKAFSDTDAGFLIPDAHLSSSLLRDIISDMRDHPEKRDAMSARSKKLYVANASDKVVDCIHKVISH